VANHFHVRSGSGDDSTGDGSYGSPFATISKAFTENADVTDSFIYVDDEGDPGNNVYYVEDDGSGNILNQINSTGPGTIPIGLTIMASGTAGIVDGRRSATHTPQCAPIVDGLQTATHAIKANRGWTIQGITFRRFGTGGAQHYAIFQNLNHQSAIVRDCTFTQISGTAAVYFGGYLYGNPTQYHRNVVYNCMGQGLIGPNSLGDQRGIAYGNLVYNCGGIAITCGEVYHNTVHGTPSASSNHNQRSYAINSRSASFNIVTDANVHIRAIQTYRDDGHSYNFVSGTYDDDGNHTPTDFHGDPNTGDQVDVDPEYNDKDNNDFTLPVADSPVSALHPAWAPGSESPCYMATPQTKFDYPDISTAVFGVSPYRSFSGSAFGGNRFGKHGPKVLGVAHHNSEIGYHELNSRKVLGVSSGLIKSVAGDRGNSDDS